MLLQNAVSNIGLRGILALDTSNGREKWWQYYPDKKFVNLYLEHGSPVSPDSATLFYTAINHLDGSGFCDDVIEYKCGLRGMNMADGSSQPWNVSGVGGHTAVSHDGATVFTTDLMDSGGYGGHDVYAIDTSNGRVRWKHEGAKSLYKQYGNGCYLAFNRIVIGRTVFVGCDYDNYLEHPYGSLTAIDATDGTVKWKFRNTIYDKEHHYYLYDDVKSYAPAVTDDAVYVGCKRCTLHEDGECDFTDRVNGICAIEASTGELNWFWSDEPYFTPGGVTHITPVVSSDGSRLYFTGYIARRDIQTDCLVAINTATGAVSWMHAFKYSFDTDNSPAISPDGLTVYSLEPRTSYLQAFSTSDGTLKWTSFSRVCSSSCACAQMNCATGIAAYPAVSPDGKTVFVGNPTDNQLFAINT